MLEITKLFWEAGLAIGIAFILGIVVGLLGEDDGLNQR